MREIEEYRKIVKYIRLCINNDIGEKFIIGIDGADGAGKTTFADKLADDLCVDVIHLDDKKYLQHDQNTYIDALQPEAVKADIESCGRCVILDGLLMLKAAERIGLSLSCHIYVKRSDQFGAWYEEDIFGCIDDPDETIREQEALAVHSDGLIMPNKTVNPSVEARKGKINALKKELIYYHYKYQPNKTADVIFIRKEK